LDLDKSPGPPSELAEDQVLEREREKPPH